MDFKKSEKYDRQFASDNMMGPNSLKMIEELTSAFNLHSEMRVLDLGCGKGLTSIFLAKEFGVQVFATDLWIGATENNERFKRMGLENLIIPIHADATDLPFAEEYFDVVISIDAYHYFGREASFMEAKLAPFVKTGGQIALSFPGFKEEIHDHLPSEILLSWSAEDMETFHSCNWWKNVLSQSKKIHVDSIEEMTCFEVCWNDWLSCNNEYAINDKCAMDAGAGKYMNIISVLATKNA